MPKRPPHSPGLRIIGGSTKTNQLGRLIFNPPRRNRPRQSPGFKPGKELIPGWQPGGTVRWIGFHRAIRLPSCPSCNWRAFIVIAKPHSLSGPMPRWLLTITPTRHWGSRKGHSAAEPQPKFSRLGREARQERKRQREGCFLKPYPCPTSSRSLSFFAFLARAILLRATVPRICAQKSSQNCVTGG